MSFPRSHHLKNTRRGKLHTEHRPKTRTKSHITKYREKPSMADQLNEFSLCSLSEQTTLRGTQKFRNQLFVDVFDKQGHHDKVLLDEDSTEIFENFEEIKESYLMVRREPRISLLEPPPTSSNKVNFFRFSPPPSQVLSDDSLPVLKPLSIRRHFHLT